MTEGICTNFSDISIFGSQLPASEYPRYKEFLFLKGTENGNKIDNTVSNHTKEEKSDFKEPSECKIPKTEISEVTESSNDEKKVDSTSELLDFKVVYNKNKHDVSAPSDSTVAELKKKLQGLLGVPESLQKLMYKGLLQDNQTLANVGITKGAKIMLVGSTLNDVLAVSSVTKQDVAELENPANTKEPLCRQKIHKKVLDKGVPEDAMPGIRNLKV
ncbi:ubiquitin domain-containing protein UBFD1-like [Agrilus planipennis]|uniref:Ubiquitin domain-containing protein UBFD1-like n=1 Tax=Agrilus planipennis TaxID=224129 RepID=A0A7F5RIT7_AGRPL|nr:ubiquitin domain-containing protein UBFD1-like [Agrilus planipennis]